MNEADTCRKYVTPLLQAAGWDRDPHRINEQVTFTDGRIVDRMQGQFGMPSLGGYFYKCRPAV